MVSKKKRTKLKKLEKNKVVYQEYTRDEKFAEINKIQEELVKLGLGVYEDEMNRFDHICQDYIDNGTEYFDKIKFPQSNRVLCFIFKNSKRHKISAQLMYDESV